MAMNSSTSTSKALKSNVKNGITTVTSKKRPQNLFAKAPIVRLQGQPVLLFTEQQGTLLQALEAKKLKSSQNVATDSAVPAKHGSSAEKSAT